MPRPSIQLRGGEGHAHRSLYRQTVLQPAVTTVVPVVPLMLRMVSLEELLDRLLKPVF